MASLWKRENSPYWVACYTDANGNRVKKSTKQNNRTKALRVAIELEAAARKARQGLLPESCVKLDSFIRKRGYKAIEIDTDDPYTKYVIYFKEFRRFGQNMMFRIELKFEIALHDDPGGSYDDNHELYFEEARLAVYDRRMKEDPEMLHFDEPYYLEESEKPKRYGIQPIRISGLSDLETLEKILG